MSHEGKLRRGQKWLMYKDSELFKEIQSDKGKMIDVNYFLENQPKQEVKETKSKGKK